MHRPYLSRILIATAIVAGALTNVAQAQPTPGADDAKRSPQTYERRVAHAAKALARLHGELKLDARQEALWQEAEAAAKSARTAMRDQARAHHAELRELLAQPGADMRAVAGRLSALRAEGQKQRQEQLERWLRVYDALDAEQKEKARLFIKARFDRFPHLAAPGPKGA